MSAPKAEGKIMGPVEWVLLIILSVFWGGSFFFVEVALTELPPLTIVFGRVGFAAMALILLVYVIGQLGWPGQQGHADEQHHGRNEGYQATTNAIGEG